MAATKKSAANSTNASKEETVAAQQAPAAEVTAPAPAAEAPPSAAADDVTQRINAAIDKVQVVMNTAKELLPVLKSLLKDVAKLQKAQKEGKKSRKATGATADGTARKLSGFAKPTQLSKDLCEFLGVPGDSMLARTEVTRLLNKYVKDNNLQDPVDKRTIRPDGKLLKVLSIGADVPLTYFNLQSHIKHHFVKPAEAATA